MGWRRFRSFSTAAAPPFVALVWVFLERPLLPTKTPAFGGWFSLDSLVRIVSYQWLTRDFRQKFFPALCRRERAVETAARRSGMRKGRIGHQASLLQFLIFCKRLPSRRRPKANRSRVFRRGAESAPLRRKRRGGSTGHRVHYASVTYAELGMNASCPYRLWLGP